MVSFLDFVGKAQSKSIDGTVVHDILSDIVDLIVDPIVHLLLLVDLLRHSFVELVKRVILQLPSFEGIVNTAKTAETSTSAQVTSMVAFNHPRKELQANLSDHSPRNQQASLNDSVKPIDHCSY